MLDVNLSCDQMIWQPILDQVLPDPNNYWIFSWDRIRKGWIGNQLFLQFMLQQEWRRTVHRSSSCASMLKRLKEDLIMKRPKNRAPSKKREGKVLRVLLSGRCLPRNQAWLNFWETRLLTVRKSLHRSCWTELTCQGIYYQIIETAFQCNHRILMKIRFPTKLEQRWYKR